MWLTVAKVPKSFSEKLSLPLRRKLRRYYALLCRFFDTVLTEPAQTARIERAKIIRDYTHGSPGEFTVSISSELMRLMDELSLENITHRDVNSSRGARSAAA
jgi:hypothetical protein